MRRVAIARLEAALIRLGYASHREVTVRLGRKADEETRQKIKNAFEAHCVRPEASPERGSNLEDCVRFASLYGDPDVYTHIVAPAEIVNVPDVVLEVLEKLKGKVPQVKKQVDSKLVGWELSADRSASSSAGIVLSITTPKAKAPSFNLESYAEAFRDALGVPVRLEYGLYPTLCESWSHKSHASVSIGIAIGKTAGGVTTAATVTMPVKWSEPKLAESDLGASPGKRLYLAAAHPFIGRGKVGKGGRLFQPPRNSNDDRIVGSIVHSAYDGGYGAVNFFDAAIIEGDWPPVWTFSAIERIYAGVWPDAISQNNKTYIFGATSGYQEVRIESYLDSSIAVLTSEGVQVVYKDLIKFSLEQDRTRPASRAGDSGAPLLVKGDKDRYYIGGMVIAGGVRGGKVPKFSYAIPIKRTLDHLKLEAI